MIILGILTSCKKKFEPRKAENKPTEISAWEIESDTILERNNPKSLDLSNHQLFIDTTRNSEFYKEFTEWKPNRTKYDAIDIDLNEIKKKNKVTNISIGSFPKYWISLEKLKNQFVIYNQCDGNTPIYEIGESSVIIYDTHEPTANIISNFKKINDSEIILNLFTRIEQTPTEKATLSIKKTSEKYVYLLSYSSDNWSHINYVTPIEKVVLFDMVVNHCPKMKQMEFEGFDTK